MRAEELRFSKLGVIAVKRDIFLPWYNAFKFLVQGITRMEIATAKDFQFNEPLSVNMEKLTNPTDRWIIVSMEDVVRCLTPLPPPPAVLVPELGALRAH